MPNVHMRRKDKEIAGREEIEGILRSCRFAVLALCRRDEPYAVALSYGFDADRRALWFHCAREGLKLDFIAANPSACAIVVEDGGYRTGECDHAYRSVVVRGPVTLVTEDSERRRAMDVMLAHLENDPGPIGERNLKDGLPPEKTGILRLDIESWTGKRG